jgi:hypothetical protein
MEAVESCVVERIQGDGRELKLLLVLRMVARLRASALWRRHLPRSDPCSHMLSRDSFRVTPLDQHLILILLCYSDLESWRYRAQSMYREALTQAAMP